MIEPKYDLTFHFSEGVAAVMVGGKWGYIDTTGRMVIQPMPLMRAEDFHHGLAFVSTKDGKYGYIDKSGKYVWTPTLLYRD
ncbi:MAG: WG repeat-containing protein [Bryobacterales bacterium]|nr:WG repeat-containing protein [Bryobacterales bacterium]